MAPTTEVRGLNKSHSYMEKKCVITVPLQDLYEQEMNSEATEAWKMQM
jgi:hypothetical protein